MTNKNSNVILLGIVVLAACLTQLAADIYTPSILYISQTFNTGINQVQSSMFTYMLGVAFSQLIYGPISEGIGRKLSMLIGLFIMLIGTLICLQASTINYFVGGRLVQGLGAGACAGLWRTVFRDSFSGKDLAHYTSYLVIFITFIVPSAPLLGAYLQTLFGWRSNFTFMAGYAIVTIIAMMYAFKETNVHISKSKLNAKYMLDQYWVLLKSPLFMGVTTATFLSYGGFFAWFVMGPVLMIDQLKIEPTDFAWLTFLSMWVSYTAGGYFNGKFVKKFGMATMLRFGWSLMLGAALLMLIGHFFLAMSIASVMIPVVIFYFGSTFIWPNAFAAAFTPFGHIAGYAGALYGFMQIFGGAAISGLISYLDTDNTLIFGLIMLGSSALAWISYEIVHQKEALK